MKYKKKKHKVFKFLHQMRITKISISSMMLKGKVCENPKLIKTNEELVNQKGTKGKAKAWKGNIA